MEAGGRTAVLYRKSPILPSPKGSAWAVINLVSCYEKSFEGQRQSFGQGGMGKVKRVLQWGSLAGLLAGVLLTFRLLLGWKVSRVSRTVQGIEG